MAATIPIFVPTVPEAETSAPCTDLPDAIERQAYDLTTPPPNHRDPDSPYYIPDFVLTSELRDVGEAVVGVVGRASERMIPNEVIGVGIFVVEKANQVSDGVRNRFEYYVPDANVLAWVVGVPLLLRARVRDKLHV